MSSKARRKARESKDINAGHNSGLFSRDYRFKDLRFREPGGSKEMSVDGSGTPVDFVMQPPPGELWIVEYITFLLIDPGNMIAGNFGALGAPLTTGVQLLEVINSSESIYTTLKDNADVAQCFFGGVPATGGVAGADPGFLNEVDKAIGRYPMDGKVTLDGDDNDQLIFRINDDLLLIQLMQTSAHVRIES